jgi:predicted Fe-Mo cluster-binding NifX family protein
LLCYSNYIAASNQPEQNMTKTFNTDAFEAWMKANGIKWYHLNTTEQRQVIKQYKEQCK